MAKLTRQKARKEYVCSKCKKSIKKGEEYQKIIAMYKKPQIVCSDCKIARSELTSSEYYAWLFNLQDNLKIETIEDIEILLGEIENQKEELEEKYENIPEQLQDGNAGDILQDRIDNLGEVYNELDQIIEDIKYINKKNLTIEELKNLKNKLVKEKKNQLKEILYSIE